jgi:starch synthase
MYSLRYGTLPVARRTGGLADTIHDWSKNASGTGILFDAPDARSLRDAIYRALQLFYDHPTDFARLRTNAMAQDFSWKTSAQSYEQTYAAALRARRA